MKYRFHGLAGPPAGLKKKHKFHGLVGPPAAIFEHRKMLFLVVHVVVFFQKIPPEAQLNYEIYVILSKNQQNT